MEKPKTKLFVVTTIMDRGFGNEVETKLFRNMSDAFPYFKQQVETNFLVGQEDIEYFCYEDTWEDDLFYQISNGSEMFTATITESEIDL